MRTIARRSTRTIAMATETLRKVGQMQLAAASTIASRLPTIAAAMQDPNRLADPELSRMVVEKLEAAATVATTTLPRLALPAVHTARWLGDYTALYSRGLSEGAPVRSFCDLWDGWARLVEGTMLINAAFGAAMLGSMVELGSIALEPVHRAATANARRLGRK